MPPNPNEIGQLVELQLGVERAHDADRLVEDLGAESADLMNLVATLEERYDVEIDEREASRARTVADLGALVAAARERKAR